jgi:prepilin-type N-terminal cleavage/methylation domain-containing protein
MRATGGFTIIELLVVMALAAALLVVSVTGFNLARSPRLLELGATEMVADLRAVQQRARGERTAYTVTFAIGSGGYTVVRGDGTVSQVGALPSGVSIAATTWPDHRLTFSSYGNPDRAGTIRLRNRSGERSIRIDPMGRFVIGP